MSNRFIKGLTNNHLTWVMVDATDFATPESALSAAMKIKVYGKLRSATGVNFVTSGTGSLVNDIQHAGASVLGLYTIAMVKADLSDASAAWYDQYIISLSATGAAYQTLIVEGGIDTSQLLALSDAVSNVLSQVLLATSAASDAASAAQQANSRVLLVQSRLSDLDSRLSSDVSDLMSQLLLTTSAASDAASAAAQTNSRVLLIQSRLSDFESDMTSRFAVESNYLSYISNTVSGLGAGQSASAIADKVWSDYQSKAGASPSQVYSVILLGASRVSDIQSYLVVMSGVQSDIYSAVSNINSLAVLSPTVSKVASAVNTELGSRLSDILSAAVQTNSRAILIQSRLSDFDSRIVATGVPLDASTMSDLRSAITAITATISASDISDIASAVRATVASDLSDILSAAQQANSRVLLVQSRLSDFDSRIVATGVPLDASTMSDLRSAITAITATVSASDISDIASAVRATVASDLSDILSAAVQANSRVLLVQSRLSDFDSRIVATGVPLDASTMSDIRSAIAAITATVSASDISDIASAVRATVASDLSDILSAAVQTNSRVALVQSRLSDLDSRLSSEFSDLYSQVSDFRSDIHSFMSTTGVGLNASTMSDLRSAVAAVTVNLTASDISDIASAVVAGLPITSVVSDIYSLLQVVNATVSNINSLAVISPTISKVASAVNTALASRLSDTLSAAVQTNSRVLLVQSRLSDFDSRIVATGVPLDASTMSDLRSAIAAVTVNLTASDISDIASAVVAGLPITSVVSDIYSLLQVVNATVSNINSMAIASPTTSDIASAVNVELGSRLSDILSAAVQTNSRAILIQSRLSDFDSRIVATGVPLDASTMSDIRSAIAAITATVSASDISDIASAVRATVASDLSDILSAAVQTNSRVALIQSRLSDFDSRIVATGVPLDASTMSDLRSAIAAATAVLSASDISDIASAVRAIVASDLSDILSAAQQTNSRALVLESRLSDFDSRLVSDVSDMRSALSDFQSDFQSRVPKRVATDSQLSDLTSDLRSFFSVSSGIQSDIYSLLSDFVSDFGSALAEPTTAPPAAATIKQAMAWAHALNRNRITQTATLQIVRNDANAANVASAAVSDDGVTFTRGEWGN